MGRKRTYFSVGMTNPGGRRKEEEGEGGRREGREGRDGE